MPLARNEQRYKRTFVRYRQYKHKSSGRQTNFSFAVNTALLYLFQMAQSRYLDRLQATGQRLAAQLAPHLPPRLPSRSAQVPGSFGNLCDYETGAGSGPHSRIPRIGRSPMLITRGAGLAAGWAF
jgi:hypothetical protein